MYLLDESGRPVDAEFSLDVVDSEPCVVVESSGGSSPSRGVKRRNPDYNRLLNILFARFAGAGIRVVRVILDSKNVQGVPIAERVAALDIPCPVDLGKVNVDKFRKMLGRKIAGMHRDPEAIQGGNAQKRIRIVLERPALVPELLVGPDKPTPGADDIDFAPGLTTTEREYLRMARVGQGGFRKFLIKRWSGECPMTGIANDELLVASHIKPWSACATRERLDPNNGILLSPLMDRLFDRGLITFTDDGAVVVSPRLSTLDRNLCGLDAAKPFVLSEENKRYMTYHRIVEFVSIYPCAQAVGPDGSQQNLNVRFTK
jgi:HNH endonuclease